jgi:hypothetical protein
MLNALITIADALDAKGFIREAEAIDSLIRQAFNVKDMQELVTILKDTFTEAVNNPALPSITKETLPNIFAVLDAVGTKIQVPVSGEGTARQITSVQDRALAVEQGIRELRRAIGQLQDPKEIAHDQGLLRDLLTEALGWKKGRRPGDKKNWEKVKHVVEQVK